MPKGLIFKTSSVRAILAGEKTRTSRMDNRFPSGSKMALLETFYIQDWLKEPLRVEQPLEYEADGLTQCLEDYQKMDAYKLPAWAVRRWLVVSSVTPYRSGDISSDWAVEEGMMHWAKETGINGLSPQELFWRTLAGLYRVDIESAKIWKMWSIKFEIQMGRDWYGVDPKIQGMYLPPVQG